MQIPSSPCHLCPTTKAICFWGELRPYATWRRIIVGVGGFVIAAFCSWFIWQFHARESGLFVWALGLPLGAVGLLGVAASVVGCDRCVVRLYGSA